MTGLSAVTQFNLYTKHIMRNEGLDELQAGIRISGININNLRYVNDTTNGRKLRGIKEPLDEGERAGLKLNIKKKKQYHGIWPHYCMANRRGKGGSSDRFPLLGL